MPLERDFRQYPKFRHNLWSLRSESDVGVLTVSHTRFEVPRAEVERFLQMRGYCTGHHTPEEVAEHSGVPLEEVRAILGSLHDAEVTHLPVRPLETLTDGEVRSTLVAGCRIWRDQLADTTIGGRVLDGTTTREVVIGWLLEQYHYIKAFPGALRLAASKARAPLRAILDEYAAQEQGHEEFIARALEIAGISRAETESSIPLVSTRSIDFIMRELFELEPAAVLLVAAIIEAPEIDEAADADIAVIRQRLHEVHGFALEMLDPYFQHVRVDASMGHATLLERHEHLLEEIERPKLHAIVNQLHDLKHACDLRSLEIEHYYNHTGNYVPRQFVDFFAI